jgi:plastocyanin/mono/diheme cytochrome c family protein
MTDESGRTPEERLPARTGDYRFPAERPSQPAPVERFSAPPQAHTFELSPERAAKIVRQSSNARWIGFLATIIVVLFVVIYYFYDLGAPLGITKARLSTEAEVQQVTAVERGYNLFEANCARCHGPSGLGPNEPDAATQKYIGPQLNSQEKLFNHLNEDYIRNVLTVGGRYVCGNAKSAMPVWSNENGGPLNYRQIEDLIAFIRAPANQEFVVRDPSLNEPVIDPATGKEKTFHGWVDPNYQAAPGSTPYPDCYLDALGGGASPGASGGAGGGPAASIDPNAPVVKLTAPSGAATSGFDPTTLEAKTDTPFTLDFDNQDGTAPHNVVIQDSSGTLVQMGDTKFFTGPAEKKYAVPALKAGTYNFLCQVHPSTMKGTLTVK